MSLLNKAHPHLSNWQISGRAGNKTHKPQPPWAFLMLDKLLLGHTKAACFCISLSKLCWMTRSQGYTSLWHQAVPQKNIKLESNCQAMQASASKLRGFIIKTLKRQTRFSAEGIPHELDHFTEVTSCEIFGEHWLLYPSQLTWLKGPAHHSPRTRGLRCAVKPWITQSCFLTPNSKQMKTYSRKSFLSD